MARKFYKENGESIPAIKFENSLPTGFTEITDETEIKRLYKIQYGYRISDGKSFVLDFTTDKYIDVLNGTYTEAEVFALENHIKDLYDQLNNGWWLTAQNTNSVLILDGIYNQTMKDSIQAVINEYVTNNY
ncbi:unnamed protein product [marine sediment metagenome]|uniref:Uncharacterized protein n=1 Tax=marine sediment metagenome TaxID=412755 RepID=X0SKG0_9ZZZZ